MLVSATSARSAAAGHSEQTGYDPIMQDYGGLMSIMGEDETPPPPRAGYIMHGCGVVGRDRLLAEPPRAPENGQGR